MKITLLAPDGNQYQVEWENLLEFSKQACELWISESVENKIMFEEFCKSYHLFSPYYDFLLTELGYIQVGFPLGEHSYAVAHQNTIQICSLEEGDILEHHYLKEKQTLPFLEIATGTDSNLDYQKQVSDYKEGFLLPDGSLISIKTLGSHQKIGYTYLLERMIEEPRLIALYLKYHEQIVDIREFFYYILGCALIAGTETKISIYDASMMTPNQKEVLDQIEWDPMIQDSILAEFQNPFKEAEVKR